MERKRIDPESDEYKAWKQGEISLEQEPREELLEEKIAEKENKGIIHWFFFGDISSLPRDNSEEGKMRKSYYKTMMLLYFFFCFLLVYSLDYLGENIGSNIFEIFMV